MWLCSRSFSRTTTCGAVRGPPPLTLLPAVPTLAERPHDQLLQRFVLQVAGGRDDEVRRDVGVAEVLEEQRPRERLDGLRRAENRTAERMAGPVVLGEDLVDEIVGRVLDHLDLFEDHLLLALDVLVGELRMQDDVGQQVDRQRQVLVEHLDVVAGVFLRGEGVELAADRIDLLGDVLGRCGCRCP